LNFYAFIFPLIELRRYPTAQIVFVLSAEFTKPDRQVTTFAKDLRYHAYLLCFFLGIILGYGYCVDPDG
jgi:hypothetical protein